MTTNQRDQHQPLETCAALAAGAAERECPTEFHPVADLFPLLEGEELQQLCEDVAARGLLDPIVCHQGQILDGRNRYRACLQAGVPVRFVEWDGEGGSPLSFVISKNLRRRHLTASQRAMLAADALALFEAQASERRKEGNARGGNGLKSRAKLPATSRKRARDDAARAFQVSPRYVQDAKRVQAKVARGELPQSVEDEVRSGAASLQRAEQRGRTKKGARRSRRRRSPPRLKPTAENTPSQSLPGPSLTDAGRPVASELAAVLAAVLQVIRTHMEHPRLEAELRALFEEIDPTLREIFVRASQLSMRAQARFRSTL